MSSLTPAECAEFITRNEIISSSHTADLPRQLTKYPSAAALTGEFVQRGWLSRFQQHELLEGRGDSLIFGPYRLVEPLGEGGMGMVYKAWHARLDRIVALKFIHPRFLASRPELIERFQREARAFAQLNHPNIV